MENAKVAIYATLSYIPEYTLHQGSLLCNFEWKCQGSNLCDLEPESSDDVVNFGGCCKLGVAVSFSSRSVHLIGDGWPYPL